MNIQGSCKHIDFWPGANAVNTCWGQCCKHMLGPMLETHAGANAGNTCWGKCCKHMLGQMLEIYGLAILYLIKRGAAEGRPLLITYYLANPYISNIWPSMCFQHLALHIFPTFGLAYISNIWPCIYFQHLAFHMFPASYISSLPVCFFRFSNFPDLGITLGRSRNDFRKISG